MKKVLVRQEKVTIPTYPISAYDKNPMFLEKRVYQGSSGRVYPHPVCEGVSDTKIDREYDAIYLENDYLLVMILPELGGRIQRMYDKTNGYDLLCGFSIFGRKGGLLAMPRMSKQRKQEWSLFLNERNRITYNGLCRKCSSECKQSFRCVVVHPKQQKSRLKELSKMYVGTRF